jgi:hypothetical protein
MIPDYKVNINLIFSISNLCRCTIHLQGIHNSDTGIERRVTKQNLYLIRELSDPKPLRPHTGQ